MNDNCKKCRLNADIQKEFGVENDDKLRISIYREAWADTERENARLREKLEEAEKEVMLLRTIEGDQIAEILDLEGRNEELFAALNSVRNTLMRASNDIETLIRVD